MDATLEVATSVFEPPISVPEQQGPCVDDGGRIDAVDVGKLKELQTQAEKEQKTRAYWFVVWPESVNITILFQVLRASGYAILISPLHDRDIKDDTGELKKPHYHIIVRFPTARYLEPVRRLVGSWLFDADAMSSLVTEHDATWFVKPVTDWPGAVRYLCHIDDDDKAKYPTNEVISFGFCDLSPLYAQSKADDVESYYSLIAWCRQHPTAGYSQLMDAVYDSEDHALMRAMQRYSYTLKAYIGDKVARSKKKD